MVGIRSQIKGFEFIVIVLVLVVVFLFFLAGFAVEDSFFVPLFLDFLDLVDEFLHVLGFLDVANIVIVIMVSDVRGVKIA